MRNPIRTTRTAFEASSFRTFGDFTFLPDSLELLRKGERVPIPPTPARALDLLTKRAGTVVSRQEFFEILWPDQVVCYDKSLNFCILELRKALGDSSHSPRFIETRPKVGYRFRAPVTFSRRGGLPRLGARGHRWAPIVSRGAALALLAGVLVVLGTPSLAPRGPVDTGGGPPPGRLPYLQARYLLDRLALPDSPERAAALLTRSLKTDPTHADGWLALSEAHLFRGFRDAGAFDAARRALDRAQELQPDSAVVHLRRGDLLSLADWDWEGARHAYERSLDLDPDSSETHRHLATLWMLQGRFARAVDQVEQALRLEPVDAVVRGEVGWTYLYAGNFERAAHFCAEALELEPAMVHSWECALVANGFLGRAAAARDAALQVLTLRGQSAGDPNFDLQVFHRRSLEVLDPEQPRQRVDRALALAVLGRAQESLDLLEQAALTRNPYLLFRFRDPRLAPLGSEPRFQRLAQNLGLPFEPPEAPVVGSVGALRPNSAT